MKDNVWKLFLFFLFLFCLLLGQLAYWQVIAAPNLQAHSANPRSWQLEKEVWRGGIYDRNGEILAVAKNDQGRSYPLGAKAVHVVGYNSRIYGKAGLEAAYNRELLGITDRESVHDLINKVLGRKKRGQDLILTLDSSLQEAAYQALGNFRGAVAVLNPQTGEILALVSKPSFDPAKLWLQWSALNKNQESPLLNRATQGLYPPGSTLKVLLAGAALEKGVTNEKEVFHCPGYLWIQGRKLSCYQQQAHGELNLAQAVTVSCNVTFAQLGMRLGNNGLNNYLELMEQIERANLGISLVKSRFLKGKYLSANALAERAIGQGEVIATPFYLANLAGAIAKDGVLMRPYLVAEVRTVNGRIIHKNNPEEVGRLFAPTVAQSLGKMMEAVVQRGTGNAAAIPGLKIAGKTGTAENPHGQSHAWFIGFAPSLNPQLAVAVVVENGGTGGAVAAPIAKEIFLKALDKK